MVGKYRMSKCIYKDINQLYMDILKRPVDLQGYLHYKNKIENNLLNLNQLNTILLKSKENKQKTKTFGSRKRILSSKKCVNLTFIIIDISFYKITKQMYDTLKSFANTYILTKKSHLYNSHMIYNKNKIETKNILLLCSDVYFNVNDIHLFHGCDKQENGVVFDVGKYLKKNNLKYYEKHALCKIHVNNLSEKVLLLPTRIFYHLDLCSNITFNNLMILVQNEIKFWYYCPFIKFDCYDIDQYYQYTTTIDILDENENAILFLDASTPTPDKDSGSNGIFNMIHSFKKLNYNVLFCGWDNICFFEYYTYLLGWIGVRSLCHTWEFDGHTYDFQNLNNILNQHIDNAKYIVLTRLNSVYRFSYLYEKYADKIIFHTLDITHIREYRQMKIDGLENADYINEIKEKELYYIKKSKYSSVINQFELDYLHDIGIHNIILLPIVIDIPQQIMYDANTRNGVLFVGGFSHTPNIDCAKYILETLHSKKYQVHIVGSNLPHQLCNDVKEYDNIKYHNYLNEEELYKLMNQCRINIAPIRYGAGSKGKIAHSLAHCLPTISTDIGTEGMCIPENAIVESNIDKFSIELDDLYENNERLNKLSIEGYKCAINNFSFNNFYKIMHNIFKL
jgi:glycosyltransferase involved in cell wall biosynthesis